MFPFYPSAFRWALVIGLRMCSKRFAHNGKYFVTGSEDKSARLFDIRSAQELIGYSLNNAVTSVELSKSGRYAFIGVADFSGVAIWDAVKGEEVGSLKGHKSQVSNIGLSGDGRALCTASWDGTLKVCHSTDLN